MACRSPCSSILLRPMMMMMVMVSSLLVWGVGHGMAQPDDYAAPEMDTVESEAVYRILESINSGVPWRALHPNNLCLYGPHGLACEAEKEETKKKTNSNSSNNSSSSSSSLHVVELSLGWVSDSDNAAACGRSAALDVAALRRLRYLRKLMLYRCFVQAQVDLRPLLAAAPDTLAHLVLMDNPALTGGLPGSIGRLTRLQRLVVLRNPRLRGPVPPEIGRLWRLEEVVLSENGLTGTLPPPAFASLQALKILDLRGNGFHGSLPEELGGLESLRKLDVSWNGLSGPIPPGIGAQMELLDLSHNRFTGGVPASLGRLANLRVLEMGHNPDLGGDLPDMWAEMGGLRRLSIASSGVGGRLPPSLGRLLSLSSLDLSNNSLSGGLGFELGSLPSLYRVDLRNNRLVGMLPFPPQTIRRLGRNLLIGGNPGLCVASDWVQLYSAHIVGAHPCPTTITITMNDDVDDDDASSHLFQQHDTFSAAWAFERRHTGSGSGSSSRIDPASSSILAFPAASILAALFLL